MRGVGVAVSDDHPYPDLLKHLESTQPFLL